LYKFQFPDTALVSNELLAYNTDEMAYLNHELLASEPEKYVIPRVPLGYDGMPRVEVIEHGLQSGLNLYNPAILRDASKFVRSENATTLVAGRVEESSDEFSSQVSFFSLHGNKLDPIVNAPKLENLQDPFATTVQLSNGKTELIFGGVEVEPVDPTQSNYRTVLFKGSTLNGLELFARGPEKGKGLRIVQNPFNGELWMFVRFQADGVGGLGRIGCARLNSWDEINEQTWASASVIPGLYKQGQWGGANHAEFITPQDMLVLAHKARFEPPSDILDDRRYDSELIVYRPDSNLVLARQTIVTAEMLPSGLEVGRLDCKKVTYPGSFYRTRPTTLECVLGAMDAHPLIARKVEFRSLLARAGILQTVLAQ
jgi:hypothetical protein